MLLHWASSEGFKLKSILDIVWQSFQTHHYIITAAIQHCRSHSVSRFEYKVNLTLARFNGGRFYYRMIYIWPQSRRAALGEDGIMMQWDTVPPPVDLQAHGTWPLNYLRALQQSAIQTYIYTQQHNPILSKIASSIACLLQYSLITSFWQQPRSSGVRAPPQIPSHNKIKTLETVGFGER